MLDKLDELGITEDTIVMYSTDNGVHYNTWPDAGITPFRSEKNTNWEGGWRVPAFVRWPGHFKAGTVLNSIVTHQDWMISHAYIIYMMQGVVASQIENFVKFPPRQKPASFNLDAVMRDLEEAGGGANH